MIGNTEGVKHQKYCLHSPLSLHLSSALRSPTQFEDLNSLRGPLQAWWKAMPHSKLNMKMKRRRRDEVAEYKDGPLHSAIYCCVDNNEERFEQINSSVPSSLPLKIFEFNPCISR